MRQRHSWWGALVVGGVLAGVLAGCAEAPSGRTMPSLLDAQGTGAAIIGREWWILFTVGAAVFLLVVGLMAAAIVRQKRRHVGVPTAPHEGVRVTREGVAGGPYKSVREGEQAGARAAHSEMAPEAAVRASRPDAHAAGDTRWIWWGGIALPLVVLLGVFALNVSDIRALGAPPSPETVAVRINGHRWWWEVEYPDLGITTANQVYVPVGQAVKVELTSADVIHSFWVPQLQYKRDLIPGQTNTMWLQADKPGVYRSLCAEYCGLQHAQMHMTVVALAPAEFEQWMAHEGSDAVSPSDPLAQAGQQVFLGKGCLYCHAIRGAGAAGEVGPDLTHLASRLTLAAGSLENNTGNLGGWILDPQHIKPGALMPPTPLSGQELQELLAYLNSLK